MRESDGIGNHPGAKRRATQQRYIPRVAQDRACTLRAGPQCAPTKPAGDGPSAFSTTEAGAAEGIHAAGLDSARQRAQHVQCGRIFSGRRTPAGIRKAVSLWDHSQSPPKHAISQNGAGRGRENACYGNIAWDSTTSATKPARPRLWEIAAIETSVHAVDLFDWKPRFRFAWCSGHEVTGIRKETIAGLCDTHVRIPMLGSKHSFECGNGRRRGYL